MPRQPSVPKLTLHKASGKAVVRLNGRDHYLGVYGSPEAKAAYDRLIAEWLAAGRRDPVETAQTESSKPAPISVNEVLLAFWRHAERHYQHPNGTPTSEIKEYKYSLRPVREMYGTAPAGSFGPRALAAVRQKILEAAVSRAVNRTVSHCTFTSRKLRRSSTVAVPVPMPSPTRGTSTSSPHFPAVATELMLPHLS